MVCNLPVCICRTSWGGGGGWVGGGGERSYGILGGGHEATFDVLMYRQ